MTFCVLFPSMVKVPLMPEGVEHGSTPLFYFSIIKDISTQNILLAKDFQRRYIYGMSSDMVKTRIEEVLAERGRSLYWLAKESGVTYAALWNLKERRTDGIT